MKIFAVIEHRPATGRIRRGRIEMRLSNHGFRRLPGVAGGWVSDHKYETVEDARAALIQASEEARVPIVKAYVVEYGDFAVIP